RPGGPRQLADGTAIMSLRRLGLCSDAARGARDVLEAWITTNLGRQLTRRPRSLRSRGTPPIPSRSSSACSGSFSSNPALRVRPQWTQPRPGSSTDGCLDGLDVCLADDTAV